MAYGATAYAFVGANQNFWRGIRLHMVSVDDAFVQAMDVSRISKAYPVGRAVRTPSAGCLESKLFKAFIKCFALKAEDVKRPRG